MRSDDPLSAVRRVAAATTIILLDAGAQGESYLSWGEHLQDMPWVPGELGSWLDGLVARRPAANPAGAQHPGWCDFRGGVFVQLDYEVPATPPRAWQVRGWVSWSDGREPTFHGTPERCRQMRRELEAPPAACVAALLDGEPQPDCSAAQYQVLIRRIQALIAAGTLYQANLTTAFSARHGGVADGDLAAFLALAALSPAPFAAFIRAPGRPTVISHSPECFLRGRGDQVRSVPIKGTRRRVPGTEPAVRAALLASRKDLAELTMIIDLVRNDLGRIAVAGSVQVAQRTAVMDLDYAHHLYGEVVARLPEAIGYGAAVAAAFPAGSITGAPKLQAMAQLRQLETHPRGAYCGSFGWIGAEGCDLAVAIRTMTWDDSAIHVHAGGGIVADSQPAAEWDEVQVKAGTMLRALAGSHA